MKEDTLKITPLQLFIAIIFIGFNKPAMYGITEVYPLVKETSWLIPALALIPGLFYLWIYKKLIDACPWPLPRLFQYYWGKYPGYLIGLAYVLYIVMLASLWLRTYVDFHLTMVTPSTPISVLVGTIMVTCAYGIRKGLVPLARALEIMFWLVLVLYLVLLLLAVKDVSPANLVPVLPVSWPHLALATIIFSRYYSYGAVVLLLGYFLQSKNKVHPTGLKAMFTLALLLTCTVVIVLGSLGGIVQDVPYPTFIVVRNISLGGFINNTDAIFILIWLIGIFGGLSLIWLCLLYTIRELLSLGDYRPLALATLFIIAITSLQMGSNVIVVRDLIRESWVPLTLVFNVIFPLITLAIGWARGLIRRGQPSAGPAAS